jgi:hypothetical protein
VGLGVTGSVRLTGSREEDLTVRVSALRIALSVMGIALASGFPEPGVVVLNETCGAQATEDSGIVSCEEVDGVSRVTFAPLPEVYVRWYQNVSIAGVSQADGVASLSDPGDRMTISIAATRTPETERITSDTGTWHLFEWHVVLNTPGVSDGITELWVDDAGRAIDTQTLRLRRDNVQWRGRGDAGILLATLRLPASGHPHGLRWNHLAISSRHIGASAVPVPPAGPRIVAEARTPLAIAWR